MIEDGRRVVRTFLDHQVRRTPWTALTDWAPAQWGRAGLRQWVDRLSHRPATPPPRPRRSSSRLLVAASVLRRLDADADAAFDGAGIGNDLLTWLPVVREPGSRAATVDQTAHVQAQGVSLARDLIAMELVP
jgi:hypothetical protein